MRKWPLRTLQLNSVWCCVKDLSFSWFVCCEWFVEILLRYDMDWLNGIKGGPLTIKLWVVNLSVYRLKTKMRHIYT